jgi:hypothetical protein
LPEEEIFGIARVREEQQQDGATKQLPERSIYLMAMEELRNRNMGLRHGSRICSEAPTDSQLRSLIAVKKG